MVGAICKWDIIAHPIVTIRSFGWRVFWRALLAGRRQTFLSLLTESGTLRPVAGEATEAISRCVALELRAMRIYQTLAERFARDDAPRELLATLARHEQGHADLLRVCQAEAAKTGADAASVDLWQEAVPRVERCLDEIEATLDSISELPQTLRVVVHLESSEINRLFAHVVAASDSAFVRALDVFRYAGQSHLLYIRHSLLVLDPSLDQACQQLRI